MASLLLPVFIAATSCGDSGGAQPDGQAPPGDAASQVDAPSQAEGGSDTAAGSDEAGSQPDGAAVERPGEAAVEAGGSAEPGPETPPAPADQPGPVIDEIRREATRPNDDPIGRPLPLAALWTNMAASSGTTVVSYDFWGLAYQREAIEDGHFLLPLISIFDRLDETELPWFVSNRLPLSFASHNWEGAFSHPPYISAPADRNPNVINLNGSIRNAADPLGPVEPWRQVGREGVGSAERLRRVQAMYPDPPRVILISNNEHGRLWWHESEMSKRYMDRHGAGRSDEYKRRVTGDGWIERYRALVDGVRGSLVESWRSRALFVAYNACVGYSMFRWGGWWDYALTIQGRLDPSPFMWDGGSCDFYVYDWDPSTDKRVWSPQIGGMVWPDVMLPEFYRANPQFWWELATWEGGTTVIRQYEQAGETFTPARYGGFVQFGLWLAPPRAVRDFRYGADTPAYQTLARGMFLEVMRAVDRVRTDPTLRRFWRKGKLVPNRAHQHVWNASVPAEYQGRDRWFLLDTSVDPPRPWNNDTTLRVFSLAYSLGSGEAREWLLYAHSPVRDRTGVRITIPEFGEVTVDVPVGGAFHHVTAADRTPRRVGM